MLIIRLGVRKFLLALRIVSASKVTRKEYDGPPTKPANPTKSAMASKYQSALRKSGPADDSSSTNYSIEK